MLIGTLAQRTGLSPHTLRYYEKEGLIAPFHWKRLPNGYKDYSDTVLERISLVKMAKRLRFPLSEILALISRWESHSITPVEKVELLRQKIGEIDGLIAELTRNKGLLEERVRRLEQS